jgi:hypothetical protein
LPPVDFLVVCFMRAIGVEWSEEAWIRWRRDEIGGFTGMQFAVWGWGWGIPGGIFVVARSPRRLV